MDDYNDPVVTKIEDKIEKDDKIYTEEELEEMETTTSYAQ
jgi:hypothetical protein